MWCHPEAKLKWRPQFLPSLQTFVAAGVSTSSQNLQKHNRHHPDYETGSSSSRNDGLQLVMSIPFNGSTLSKTNIGCNPVLGGQFCKKKNLPHSCLLWRTFSSGLVGNHFFLSCYQTVHAVEQMARFLNSTFSEKCQKKSPATQTHPFSPCC